MAKKAKPKRTKKYCKAKRAQRVASHELRNLIIAYVSGLRGCVFIDMKEYCIVRPSRALVGLASIAHPWSCYLSVHGTTQLGEHYSKSEQLFSKPNERRYQSELASTFESYHHKLIETMPEAHRRSTGWLACPNGREFSEKEAGEIFARLGAWDQTITDALRGSNLSLSAVNSEDYQHALNDAGVSETDASIPERENMLIEASDVDLALRELFARQRTELEVSA